MKRLQLAQRASITDNSLLYTVLYSDIAISGSSLFKFNFHKCSKRSTALQLWRHHRAPAKPKKKIQLSFVIPRPCLFRMFCQTDLEGSDMFQVDWGNCALHACRQIWVQVSQQKPAQQPKNGISIHIIGNNPSSDDFLILGNSDAAKELGTFVR